MVIKTSATNNTISALRLQVGTPKGVIRRFPISDRDPVVHMHVDKSSVVDILTREVYKIN